MKKILLLPAICALFVSCNGNSNNNLADANDMDQMQSNSEQPSDWDITTRVKKTIMSDNSLSAKARTISVTTNNGVVTLTGTVISKDESRRVVRMVKNVPGVTNVNNQLNVSSS
jgi:hyperosmotically inducible protein